ncbi:hypothetical protein BB558_001486 [Smittium angustum]|uniref:Transcription initiation factor IIA large subunit n=1 Tax=Smittium angustum TaxID=133377 RepID=A0A2U1JBC8_SMIAN|nr:hypothetical protein BB558_001486 [Smittium angustum]
MSSSVVAAIYQQVIEDVIRNVQRDFEDTGVDISVLQELQRLWETKIIQSRVTNFPPEDVQQQYYEENPNNQSMLYPSAKFDNKQKSRVKSNLSQEMLIPGQLDEGTSEEEYNALNTNHYPAHDNRFGGQSAASLASIINSPNVRNPASNTTLAAIAMNERRNIRLHEDYDNEDQNSSEEENDEEAHNAPLSGRPPMYLNTNRNIPLASLTSLIDSNNTPRNNPNFNQNGTYRGPPPPNNQNYYQQGRYNNEPQNQNRNPNNNNDDEDLESVGRLPFFAQNDGTDDYESLWKEHVKAFKEKWGTKSNEDLNIDTIIDQKSHSFTTKNNDQNDQTQILNISKLIPQLDGDTSFNHRNFDNDDKDGVLDDDEDTKDEDAINSDLDDTDDEEVENGGEVTDHMVLCQYDKVSRTKNKWKCILKDGIMLINGRNYLFHRANGDFEW